MNQGRGDRFARLEWDRVLQSLDQRGYATTPALLTPAECAELAALYDIRARFRSRVEMARLRFGVGEYKYFAAPLPPIVADLRELLYPRVVPIANQWVEKLRLGPPLPPTLDAFLAHCRTHGQSKPTPLLLRYEGGGYNCLHQDLYGEVVFPLQFTLMLSRRGTDYEGGEFLLMEQRPRAQPRGEAITLDQGEAIVFATRYRPVKGGRGYYRVNIRHGISSLHAGRRYALGIIFHDAK
jgi:hypothetical protein